MSSYSRKNIENKPKKLKAAIYIRVSTEEQAKEGFSLSGQEEALKSYSQSLGYELYKIYRDEGKSAKDMKHRPALQQLLKDAEKKYFTAIFVYKLDRFSRSLKDLILTIEKLKDIGIDFISLQDKIETASASGKLMFHIISSFAEFERDIISERTRFGMAEKAREGGIVGKAALGYKISEGKLILDPEKSIEIRKMFQTFLDADISLSKLAKQHDITTKGLIKLLQNRTYLGEIKFRDNYAGLHEPIITQELFNKVQDKLHKLSLSRDSVKYTNFIKTIFSNVKSEDKEFLTKLSSLLLNKAILCEERTVPLLKEPSSEDLKIIKGDKQLEKYVVYSMLREEGFSDDEIFFDRMFINADKPNISAISEDKIIYIDCSLDKIFSIEHYLVQNIEFWLIISGIYPWQIQKDSKDKLVKCITFRKGPYFEE